MDNLLPLLQQTMTNDEINAAFMQLDDYLSSTRTAQLAALAPSERLVRSRPGFGGWAFPRGHGFDAVAARAALPPAFPQSAAG